MRVFILTLLLGVALLISGCDSKPAPPAERPADAAASGPRAKAEGSNLLRIQPDMLRDLKVTIAQVAARPSGEGSVLLGELRVNENAYAEIGAPVPSRILSLHANPGQRVKPGQTLATLQSTELGKARADFINAQTKLGLAQQVLARKQRLGAEKIVPEREIQEAQAAVDSAQAELRAAQAALRALGVSGDEASDSSQYQLRSPITGIVIERTAIRGQMAMPSDKLFAIGDLSTLWLTVQAFERDAVRIRPGIQVRISFPALPGSSFVGTVDFLGREVNPQSRTVTVRVVIPNQDGKLRPGMSATAWVTPGEAGVATLTVPAAALQRLQGEWVVFLPTQHPGEFELRKVGRGRDLGGEIEVLNGLTPTDKVVVEGAFLLKAEAEKRSGEGEEHQQ